MKTMVVDNGARGEALGRKLASEGHRVFMSPGNPGSEDFADNTGIEPTSIAEQRAFARVNRIGMTVVGMDMPLELGIVDAFKEQELPIFGPTQTQARVETDRIAAKRLALDAGLPVGVFATFTDIKNAKQFAADQEWPKFAKLNGLAGGKGAINCDSLETFEETIEKWHADGLVSDKHPIVVEEYIEGSEASHHAFCDGLDQLSIPFLVRDHKTIGEGNTGPMTGGMGAIGPLPAYSARQAENIGENIVKPMVRRTGFRGLLFTGFKGDKILEFNARFGDPEGQVFLALMKSDLLPVIEACVYGRLAKLQTPQWQKGKWATDLVLGTVGYPDNPVVGEVIEGIEKAAKIGGVTILQAGTEWRGQELVTKRGRALHVLSVANHPGAALDQAYKAASHITFDGQPPVYRQDVDWR